MPELEVGRPAPSLEGIAAKKASVAAPPPFHALLVNPSDRAIYTEENRGLGFSGGHALLGLALGARGASAQGLADILAYQTGSGGRGPAHGSGACGIRTWPQIATETASASRRAWLLHQRMPRRRKPFYRCARFPTRLRGLCTTRAPTTAVAVWGSTTPGDLNLRDPSQSVGRTGLSPRVGRPPDGSC
jgi:hypothetical protein